MEVVYPVARNVLWPPLRFGLRWTIEGARFVPSRGPVILVSNHHSYLDPFTLAYVADTRHRRVRFLAKAELFEKRPLGALLRGAHQIPVLRNSPSAAGSLQAAVDAVRAGECVAIFPEGTISLDLDPMAGKSGTARLAQATGVPVTPVGLWGTHRILFKGRDPEWRWGVPQTAVVGPPLRIRPDEPVDVATDRIMAEICRCLARARELYPERPGAGEDDWWYRPPETARLRSCRRRPPEVAS
ncbi:MAG: 1-acyl-sn-glycerol-3-phosphate acyltransferase [Acidimicrobiia bacterium]|nr:1-acyl-sn-glycerol-3-phosphate acyltransferase [Acidimicrobiia bacterium]